MEFMELKKGNMTVAEYATKFKEPMRYFPHYQGRDGDLREEKYRSKGYIYLKIIFDYGG